MSRNRLVFGVLAISLTAAGVLWLAGVRLVSAGTVQPDVAALALMPPETSALIGLDIDGLRSTLLYPAWKEKADAKMRDQDYQDFVSRTGFDPERDLASVTAGAWKESDKPAFLAVVNARYSRASVAAFLTEKGSVTENYRGYDLFRSRHSRHSDGALALVDDHTILAGTLPAVKRALDQKAQPGPSAVNNSALVDRVSVISSENQAWAVSLDPGSFLPRGIGVAIPGEASTRHTPAANAFRILQTLEGSTVAVNATSGIRLLLEGVCASEEDARTLADAARGLLAMGRLAAPANHPEWLQIVMAFRVEQDQKQVRMTGNIPAELLNRLLANSSVALPH